MDADDLVWLGKFMSFMSKHNTGVSPWLDTAIMDADGDELGVVKLDDRTSNYIFVPTTKKK
jgi:hypothetical protein